MKKIFISLILPVFICLIAASCSTKAPEDIFKPGNGPYLNELEKDLYFVEDFNNGGNVCFLVSKKGVVVIDAGYYPGPTSEVTGLVHKVTEEPIILIVYTHCHYDHVGGVAGWPEDVPIIAHNNLPENLEEFVIPQITNFRNELEEFGEDSLRTKYGESFEQLLYTEIKEPNETFSEMKIIKLDNYNIELHYPGTCHTDDNIIVYFPDQKAIHTGDLVFNGRHPFISKAYKADAGKWLATLKEWSGKDIETVIPGHGKPGGVDILVDQADYLTRLIMAVEEYQDSELDVYEMSAEIHGRYFSDYEYASYFDVAVETILLNSLAEEE